MFTKVSKKEKTSIKNVISKFEFYYPTLFLFWFQRKCPIKSGFEVSTTDNDKLIITQSNNHFKCILFLWSQHAFSSIPYSAYKPTNLNLKRFIVDTIQSSQNLHLRDFLCFHLTSYNTTMLDPATELVPPPSSPTISSISSSDLDTEVSSSSISLVHVASFKVLRNLKFFSHPRIYFSFLTSN